MGAGRAPAWHLCFVFCVSFVLLFSSMDRTVTQYDEGLVLFGAVRVMNGDVPYRDFYANYGPAQFYVLAGLFKAFGPSVLVARIWDLLVRAAISVVVYAIFARIGSPRMAAIASAISVAWLSVVGYMYYEYPAIPCLLLALLSAYLVLPVYCGRSGRMPLLLSGACVGAAALFRHDVGLMAAVAHIAALIVFHFQARIEGLDRRSQLLASISALVAGILLVAVPVWSLVLMIASPTEVIRDLVLIPMETYARMRSLPFPSLRDVGVDLLHLRLKSLTEGAVFLPPVAALLGAVTALRFAGGRSSGTGMVAKTTTSDCCRRGALLLLASFSLLFFFKGVVRVSLIHMTLAIVPALLILLICTVWLWTSSNRFTRLLAVLIGAYTVLVSVVPVRSDYRVLMSNLRWVSQPARAASECHFESGLDRLGCFTLDSNELDAIRFVQERTTNDERIFVGLTRHDRIFVNDVLFYFVSKRLSATKWHHFDPGVQTSREIQSEMIAELERRQTRVIVLNADWENLWEPNDSSISSGVTILDEFIRTHYGLAATFGKTHVYISSVEGASSSKSSGVMP